MLAGALVNPTPTSFCKDTESALKTGGYGWARTTDLSIMSAAL